MRIALLLPLLFCLSVGTIRASDSHLTSLQQVNALLQAEYELARTGKPYLFIDLSEQHVRLKVSGLSLTDWPINGFRRWGNPSAHPAAGLVRKHSLDEPERDVQVVNSAAPVAPSKKAKAYELSDMPTAYRMRLENGTEITVRPTPTHWLTHLRSALAIPFWYLSRPLISDWKFLRGSPYNELALSLTEHDARMLYWAFNEGNFCLIRLPGTGAAAAPAVPGTNR